MCAAEMADGEKTISITTMAVGLIQANCIVLKNSKLKTAVVFDAGGDEDRIVAAVGDFKLTHIVATHAHLDHIMGVRGLKQKLGGTVCLHRSDLQLWQSLASQCRMFGIPFSGSGPDDPDVFFDHDDELELAGATFKVIHTPGHSSGSVSLYSEGLNVVLTGDTLFNMGVGRTDLFDGDAKTLHESIQKRLFTLPEDTRMISGHGSDSTIGHEKRHNFMARFPM